MPACISVWLCALCDICDMNASLNVLLYLSGIVFEAGSSRPPPPGAPLGFPRFPFYFPLFLYICD
jgi:hypothetical protein